MDKGFNELEIAILNWAKNRYPNSSLSKQIDSVIFLKRNWTGVGYYVDILIPRSIPPIEINEFGGKWPINGPTIISEQIENGGGVIMWGFEGYIECIEMYSFGNKFGETISNFTLK